MNFESLHPFHLLIISILIGFIVGLQRQWAEEDSLAGIRTFSLITLFGTICALLAERFGPSVLIGGLIATTFVMAIGHFSREAKDNSSLGSEFAILGMFGVGALVVVGPVWLAPAIAGSIAVILHAKLELHTFASRFNARELKAIMQFVLISLVIFPIIPNRTMGPLNVLNPHDVWLMVIMIVAIGISGYIAYKFFGQKAGTLLAGILGGLISSTAATVSNAKHCRDQNQSLDRSAAVIAIAWSLVYLRLGAEIVAVAPSFTEIWWRMLLLFLTSVAASIWIWKHSEHKKKGMFSQGNPSELKVALGFALVYSLVLLAMTYAKQYLGYEGMFVVAIVSGFTDMDAVTLSTAKLVEAKKFLPQEGWQLILSALISNTLMKGGLAWIMGGVELAKRLALPCLLPSVAGVIILLTT